MVNYDEALKAIETRTKVNVTRYITALTILDRDDSVEKSDQVKIEIPKLYDALIDLYHRVNRYGEKLGGLTPEKILEFALDSARTIQKYPAAYGASMKYLYMY
jgi:hypothetical protein